MFPPTQCEQPPQCVSNPESIVTELERECLLMFPPTPCVSNPESIVTTLDTCCLREAANSFASCENLQEDPFLHVPSAIKPQQAFTTQGVDDGREDGYVDDHRRPMRDSPSRDI